MSNIAFLRSLDRNRKTGDRPILFKDQHKKMTKNLHGKI